MKSAQKQMISAFLKEARLAKGYTQKELSDLSNISIRSIQRIENGEILPRSYTLKTLSEILGVSFETIRQSRLPQSEADEQGEVGQRPVLKINKAQKIILSVGFPIFIFFGCWAYIAQSPTFPETLFELLTFITVVFSFTLIFLFYIWRSK